MARGAIVTGNVTSLVRSDSEPDLDPVNSTAKVSAARTTARRVRGRPPGTAKKTTKAASKSTRRTIDRSDAATSASARQALVDKSNASSTRALSKVGQEERDDQGGMAAPEHEKGSTRGPRSAKATRGRLETSTESKTLKAGGSALKWVASTVKADCHPSREIAETQEPEPMRLDENGPDGPSDLDEPSTANTEVDVRGALMGHDTDDVSARRRLGELAKRYENLEMRHRDLQEVGVKAAERNFERFKRQAEENILASNRLILQLKEELAAQSALVEHGEHLRQQLERSEVYGSNLQAKADALATSLSTARSENQTLSARLVAASRNAEASLRVPGGAPRPMTASSRAGPSEAVHAAQAKEDLYGDLTGLIVRGLMYGDEEDVFDCIQTGRNGTLHFKLALERGDESDKYQDVQFTYRPQLDGDRDRGLMEILPDYLVEEITFPRSHAAKFYSRVIKSLTERMN